VQMWRWMYLESLSFAESDRTTVFNSVNVHHFRSAAIRSNSCLYKLTMGT